MRSMFVGTAWLLGSLVIMGIVSSGGFCSDPSPAPDDSKLFADLATDLPVHLRAGSIRCWKERKIRIFVALDNVRVRQGDFEIHANRVVIRFFEDRAKATGVARIEVYAEAGVAILRKGLSKRAKRMFVVLVTRKGFAIRGAQVVTEKKAIPPGLLERADAARTAAASKGWWISDEPLPPPPQPVKKSPPPEVPEIYADNIESWREGDMRIIVATGNVYIIRGKYELTADSVVLWVNEKEVNEGVPANQVYHEFYAEGNVTLFREKDVLKADRVFANDVEHKALLENGQIRSVMTGKNVPIIVGGKEVRQVAKGQYKVKDGYVTTCEFAKPHFHIAGQKVRLIETKGGTHREVSSLNNFFKIGNLPVFYWPFLSKDLNERSFLLESLRIGNSSKLGGFVLSDWNLYDLGLYRNNWSHATLQLDYYSRRGPATGLNIKYGKKNFFGYINSYYVKDTANKDSRDRPIKNEDRGRFLWRNRYFMPEGWRLDTEVSYLSDKNFLQDYFEQEYNEGKEQETTLYLRKLSGNAGLTLLEKHKLNRFQTQVEEEPTLAFYLIGQPLLDGTLNFSSRNEFGNLKRNEEKGSGIPDSPHTLRGDTRNTLMAPLKLGIFKVVPFSGVELTRADHGMDRGGIGRVATVTGLMTSTQFSRIYNVHNDLLSIHRLRHIVVPEMKYTVTPKVTRDPRDFIQFDEIDRVDDYQYLFIGLKNRFQTKRGAPGHERTVEFLMVDLELNCYPGGAGENRYHHDFIEGRLRWRINDYLTFVSNGNELNISNGEIDVASAGLAVDLAPRWSLYAGHRYSRHDSSVSILSLRRVLNKRWMITASQYYDFTAQQNMESKITLTRYLHQWQLDITFERDEGEKDSIASISISPRGLGNSKFEF